MSNSESNWHHLVCSHKCQAARIGQSTDQSSLYFARIMTSQDSGFIWLPKLLSQLLLPQQP